MRTHAIFLAGWCGHEVEPSLATVVARFSGGSGGFGTTPLTQLCDRGVELPGHFAEQVTALAAGLAGGNKKFIETRTEDAMQFAFNFRQARAQAFYLAP